MAAAHRHISFSLAFLFASLGIVRFSAALQPPAQPAAQPPQDERAEDAPEVENAKFQFRGTINANGVLVRSGPSNNYYPTMKLDREAEVTVVGIKFDWLKIVPPEGSFCYVPQVFVTRRGDGKVGRVNNPLNVRAGSSLNQIKTTIQCKLQVDEDVTILGEQDEYFKIAPPKDAYLYINKQHVKPGKPVFTNDQVAKNDEKPVETPEADKPQPDGPEGPEVAGRDEPTGEATDAPPSPQTQPIDKSGKTEVADAGKGPASRPSVVAIANDYRKVEADFETASKLPVIDQPLEELTERYTTLSKSDALTSTAKQTVNARLMMLKWRSDARDQLKAFNQSKQQGDRKQQDLAMEATEIQDRMKDTQVSIYTAVGMLRVSSIQQGKATLYRLTDPATGRTVVYIRSNDPTYASLLNQFVGVKGELTTDERLRMKIVTPTEAKAVDASKVNTTIIATITPPSMVPNIATTDLREAGN